MTLSDLSKLCNQVEFTVIALRVWPRLPASGSVVSGRHGGTVLRFYP